MHKLMLIASIVFIVLTMIHTAAPAHPRCHQHVGATHCH